MPITSPSGIGVARGSQLVFISGAVVSLTVQNAQTSFPDWRELMMDLSGCTQFGLYEGHSAGANATTKYGIQYTTDATGASGWTWLDGTAGGSAPVAYVGIPAITTFYQAGPFTIDPLARRLVRLRARFLDGGATAHNFGSVGGWVR